MSSLPLATAHRIEGLLREIAGEFRPGAEVTLLVRSPLVPGDADFVMTSDTLGEAIAALERRKAAEQQELKELLR